MQMLEGKLKGYNVILASQSPRRQYLLKEIGLNFITEPNNNIDEVYPSYLDYKEIPVYLAELKAGAFRFSKYENPLVIAADTIVWCNGEVLNKPMDFNDAIKILKKISGNIHQVITGVCIQSLKKKISFASVSKVFFKKLTNDEMEYYITNYKPYDKAGAYGIQEWIGYVGIEKIEGSFYNVMGLPIQRLYVELQNF